MAEESKPKKKNPAAVALSKLGASKGGKARSHKLTAEERSAIARKGALARAQKLSAKERSAIAKKASLSRKSIG